LNQEPTYLQELFRIHQNFGWFDSAVVFPGFEFSALHHQSKLPILIPTKYWLGIRQAIEASI